MEHYFRNSRPFFVSPIQNFHYCRDGCCWAFSAAWNVL